MSVNPENPSQQNVESSAEPETLSAAEPAAEETPSPKSSNNHLAERRGRMITAGLLATVILAVIAILVSGIFQLTSRWLMVCPKDLPVNDPAPILWQDVVAQEPKPAKLGAPEKLASQVLFKSGTEEPGPPKTGAH
ncbi:MAG: hypothetical protein ACP5M0_02930 [Desulfomonilaceae bacterium]